MVERLQWEKEHQLRSPVPLPLLVPWHPPLPVQRSECLGGVLIAPAFPGDGVSMSRTVPGAIAAADATVVYNKKEAKQIKAAIKTATGQEATTSQFNCMSEFIHECKESGDGGSKNVWKKAMICVIVSPRQECYIYD